MIRDLFLLLLFLLSLSVSAQEQRKFSPEQFEADMEAYIVREAELTPQESASFFPLLRQMHEKQRKLMGQMHQCRKETPANDKAAADAVRRCDELSIKMKQIEQKYHEKMLKELSATKVRNAINAENRFHRKMMKGWQKKDRKPGPDGPKKSKDKRS